MFLRFRRRSVCLQGQDRNQLLNAISNQQYVTGGSGAVALAGALDEARNNQFTTAAGARLGVPNIAVVLTTSRSPLSSQVTHFVYLQSSVGHSRWTYTSPGQAPRKKYDVVQFSPVI